MKPKREIYSHLAVLKLGQILAYDDTVNNAAKRVFSLLAGYAGTDGTCFPSVKKMAQSLCFSRTAISKQIKNLEDHGYLKREQRFDDSRSRKPNVIIFNIDLAREYHKTPDVFSKGNVTLMVTCLATLMHYSAMQPFSDPWQGTSESCTKRKFEDKKLKKATEKATVNKAKISASSWEAGKTREREMGITPETKTELADVQIELKKCLTPAAMTDFSLSVRRKTKGMPPDERLSKTIEFAKAELTRLRDEETRAGGVI